MGTPGYFLEGQLTLETYGSQYAWQFSSIFLNSCLWVLRGRESLFLWVLHFVGIGITCTMCMFNFWGSMRLCFELICVFVIFFRAERQKPVLGITPVVSAMLFYL